MVLETKTKRKLNFLPKEILQKLIIDHFGNNEPGLRDVIKAALQKEPRKPLRYISNLGQQKLIEVIGMTTISENQIDDLYNRYLYGKNPSLFLRKINFKEPRDIDFDQFKKNVSEGFKEISDELTKNPESKVRNLETGIITGKAILDIEFRYEARIDYVDPQTEDPAFVYGLKNGIIWISIDEGIMIINVDDWMLLPPITNFFSSYFDCQIETLVLTKQIIDDIFGRGSLNRGSFYNPNPGLGRVRSKTLSDPGLLMIDEGRDANDTYDRTSSFHSIRLSDIDVGAAVDKEYGRISIRKHLERSSVRSWAFILSQRIINIVNSMRAANLGNYMNALDPNTLSSMNFAKEATSRRSLLGIAACIADMKSNNIHSSKYPFDITPFNAGLRDYFNIVFTPECPEPDCGSTFYVCKSGHHGMARVSRRGYAVKCTGCSTSSKNVTASRNVSEVFQCEKGHELVNPVEANVTIFINEAGKSLINNVLQETKTGQQVYNNECVTIKNNTVDILPINYRSEYLFDEIPSFKDAPKSGEIDQTMRPDLEKLVLSLEEKCPGHGVGCRTCSRNAPDICIQRMIQTLSGGDLGPHHGLEYGDLSFQANIDGQSLSIVCLVKSYQKRGENHQFTPSNDGDLIPQVLWAANTKSIDFVAIVSGELLEPRLKEYIRQIIESRSKKFCFIEREELIRIAEAYRRVGNNIIVP